MKCPIHNVDKVYLERVQGVAYFREMCPKCASENRRSWDKLRSKYKKPLNVSKKGE